MGNYESLNALRIKGWTMANFCHTCGAAITVQNAIFCPNCGAEVNSPSSPKENKLTSNPSGFQGGGKIGSGIAQADDFDALAWNYTPTTREEYSEGVFTFTHTLKTMVESLAQLWFEDELIDAAELSPTSFAPGTFQVSKSFTHLNDSLDGYEVVEWDSSEFGKKFHSIMIEKGAVVDHVRMDVKIDYEDENGKLVESFLTNEQDFLIGKWPTNDGIPFVQLGRIYRHPITKKEAIYWHIEALTRTRYADKDEAESSIKCLIPVGLQNILYICETKFPSSFVALSRSLSFDVDPSRSSRIPKPYIQLKKNTGSLYVEPENTTKVVSYVAPELYRLGYVLNDDLTDDEIYDFLPNIVNSLMKLPDVLLDGFSNNNDEDNVDFQTRLGTSLNSNTEERFGKQGFLVPGIIHGALVIRSSLRYSQLYDDLHQAFNNGNSQAIDSAIDGLVELIGTAVGETFLHAANTLAYRIMEAGGNITPALIGILEYCTQYPVDFQDVNALSNLALIYERQGDMQNAERVLASALERLDSGFERYVLQSNSVFWNIDNEEGIKFEVYETFFRLKTNLGKIDECRALAPKAKEFCGKAKEAGNLMTVIEKYL